MSDCFFLGPLRRAGTSQRQRQVPALEPSTVKVDEREISDRLRYLRDYARLLRYYSPDNSPGGDWTEFLENDPSTLAATVAETDPDDFRDPFEAAVSEVDAAVGSGADPGPALPCLFPPIVELIETLDDWYRRSTEGLALRRGLERLFGSVLSGAAAGGISAALRAEELGLLSIETSGEHACTASPPADPVVVIDPGRWSAEWGLGDVEADPSFLPSGTTSDEKEVAAAVRRLQRLFGRLVEALALLVAEAPSYLAETLTAYAAHSPHMALPLAFLQLLEHAREHLNTLTESHLEFYYQRVLGLEPRPAQADRVHLLFELAKSFKSHALAKDTLLKADKDQAGALRHYGTDSELVINRGALDANHGLKTIFVDRTPAGVVKNVYAAPDADSADGLGAEIEDEEGKWPAFGGTGMPYAEIGFAVASPMFLLAEGTRTIILAFSLTADSDPQAVAGAAIVEAELASNVEVRASGEKEWLEMTVEEVAVDAGPAPALTFTLTLDAGAEAIVAYDGEALGGGFVTDHPVLRLTLDNQGESAESPPRPSYPYKYLQDLEVTSLEITVEVEGLRSLILENDVGLLNAAKPFRPFGPQGKEGSRFLVGSPEVFLKPLTRIDLAIEWSDLPDESFRDHYAEYKQDDPASPPNQIEIVTGNDYFEAAFAVLRDGEWDEQLAGSTPDDGTRTLFESSSPPGPPPADRDVTLELAVGLPGQPDADRFERFDPAMRQGFLRATLKQSFLHGLYPRLLAQAAISRKAAEIPNQPYTPLMASLTLRYRANQTVDYGQQGKDDFSGRVEQLFQIGPFGHREVFPVADDATATGVPISRKLVPELTVTVKTDDGTSSLQPAEGMLLIGLDGLVPSQNLALLLQMAEGSEEPDADPPAVVWSYLSRNQEWVDFSTTEVLADATGGLLSSGIVRLALPREMAPSTTLLPNGLFWLKASVASATEAVPKMIDVHPQAVVASFRDRGNEPSHLATALAAGTIAKLKSRAAAVKAVEQPYASFGGRTRESGDAFYVRTSELLRHRCRAVTIFDYERLVLERFPEVYKVRCINHSRPESDLGPRCEHAPGHVEVVVVPDLFNKNAVDPLEPRLSRGRLQSIRDYLQELASDFVTIVVRSPDYEKLRVAFNVRFHAGRDQGFYTGQLEQDIIGFLSPWIQADAADLALGGRVHRSSVLHFVEERDYVDFVTDFKMFHKVEGRAPREVEEAEATRSSAALVSDDGHDVGDDVVSCEDA